MGLINLVNDLPLFMQTGGFTAFDFFGQLQRVGVFDLVLPFLLIFALVFGILTSTNIMGANKGVNLIIAFVIGLMALQLGFVQAFFIELFPRFAIGLAIILVVVVMAALFIPKNGPGRGWFIGFSIGGAVIGLGVIIATFDEFYWFNSFFWQSYWGLIVGGIIFVILIVAVFVTSNPHKDEDRISPKEPIMLGAFR